MFKVQANLNAVLSDRIAHIKPDQVSETLQKAVESRAAGGLFKPFVWPTESREVPDNTQLKLVLLPPDAHTDDEDELDRLRYLIQNHASGPRINKNKLVQLAGRPEDFERARGVARELLALEDIEQDRGLELSDDQKKDLKSRLASLRDTLPETAKAIYTMLYDAEDTAGKTYRIYDLSARVKTSRTIGAAVTDHLKDEDRLLDALDPALISGDHYKIWPSDKDVLGLRDLRDYFDRFPYLPYLESSDVLLDAIIRGVKNGLFEVALKNNDDYSQVWRQKNPPEAKDLHFADHYLLTKVGFVPKPAPTPSGTEDHEGGTGGTGSDGGKSTPPDKGSDDDGGTIEPKPKQTTTNVRLRFRNLPLDKVANIVDIANALEDAKGEVSLDVTVSAHNPKGLDRAILEMSVQELISQHGLEVMWEEE
ncbi:MAG: hypothetical protein U5L04_08540 [Trueperaceae bacterium]|nr:hypothetical protein [Trueperaceae bacterium]